MTLPTQQAGRAGYTSGIVSSDATSDHDSCCSSVHRIRSIAFLPLLVHRKANSLTVLFILRRLPAVVQPQQRKACQDNVLTCEGGTDMLKSR